MIKKFITILFIFCMSTLANAVPVYFVVSEIDPVGIHGDSYLLPLENASDIAYARDLISNGPSIGPSIVVAHITAGSDGINRDVLAPGEPLWSWHVDQFSEFADITAEILDGWPGLIEQEVNGGNTNRFIGFWSYTITAELTAVPLPGAFVLFLSGLVGVAAWVRGKKR